MPATEELETLPDSVKATLEAVKKNPSGEESFTTTTNGKTYAVKPNGEKGTLTGTQVQTTPAPKTSTSKTSTGSGK